MAHVRAQIHSRRARTAQTRPEVAVTSIGNVHGEFHIKHSGVQQ